MPCDVKYEIQQSRLKRLDLLVRQVKQKMQGVKDPLALARYKSRLDDLEQKKSELTKQELCEHHFLSQQDYKPFRALTLQEQRINFVSLNEAFNKEQTDLENELADITSEEIARATQSVNKKFSTGDIIGLLGLALIIRSAIKAKLKQSMLSSYDNGKKITSKELKVQRPNTPLTDTQIINSEAQALANGYAVGLEQAAQAIITAGIVSKASGPAVASAVGDKMRNESAKYITNISGTIPGQYFNRGRNNVIVQNLMKVVAYQRSEVLDGNTCPMCLSLDQKVIKPDDPMRHMEIVHTHCRGLWIPIMVADDDKPAITGISKSITDRFDKVDGRPVVNGFKNLKKPIGSVSAEAEAEVKRRLDTKKK